MKMNYDKMVKLNPKKVLFVILHHAAANQCSAEQINQWHLKRGWAGIGYHFLIRKDGTVEEGRPIQYVGAHCNGNNSCSVGVCLEGDFRKEKPTDEQIEALNNLIPKIRKVYPTIKRILNHNDLYKTACPVVNLKGMVKGTNQRGDLI